MIQQFFIIASAVALLYSPATAPAAERSNRKQVIAGVQPKVVKIYGAGGFRGLEAYQSGVLVSGEGHVLTSSSYVLDTDDVVVVLHDGRKQNAKFIAADPITEIAILKINVSDEQLPHFDLGLLPNDKNPHDRFPLAASGTRILAVSNLFGIATGNEPLSAQHGTISVVAPLIARRGGFQTNYRGDVYILDAVTNNPGAAGGALIDQQGKLLGILGKEVRSKVTNTWLNYAMPIRTIDTQVRDMIAGRFVAKRSNPSELDFPDEAWSLNKLGLLLVPNIVKRTPPYVDAVRNESPAAQAGLLADDLVVMLNSQIVPSHSAMLEILRLCDAIKPLELSVLRDGKLLQLQIVAPKASKPSNEN